MQFNDITVPSLTDDLEMILLAKISQHKELSKQHANKAKELTEQLGAFLKIKREAPVVSPNPGLSSTVTTDISVLFKPSAWRNNTLKALRETNEPIKTEDILNVSDVPEKIKHRVKYISAISACLAKLYKEGTVDRNKNEGIKGYFYALRSNDNGGAPAGPFVVLKNLLK